VLLRGSRASRAGDLFRLLSGPGGLTSALPQMSSQSLVGAPSAYDGMAAVNWEID
jgi:hypothetical protein